MDAKLLNIFPLGLMLAIVVWFALRGLVAARVAQRHPALHDRLFGPAHRRHNGMDRFFAVAAFGMGTGHGALRDPVLFAACLGMKLCAPFAAFCFLGMVIGPFLVRH